MIDCDWGLVFYTFVVAVGSLALRPFVERSLRRIGLIGAPQPKVAKALRRFELPTLVIIGATQEQAFLYRRRAERFLPSRAKIRVVSSAHEEALRGYLIGPGDVAVIVGTLASDLHVRPEARLTVLREALQRSDHDWFDVVRYAPEFEGMDAAVAEYRQNMEEAER